jgi:hypothetical protein
MPGHEEDNCLLSVNIWCCKFWLGIVRKLVDVLRFLGLQYYRIFNVVPPMRQLGIALFSNINNNTPYSLIIG